MKSYMQELEDVTMDLEKLIVLMDCFRVAYMSDAYEPEGEGAQIYEARLTGYHALMDLAEAYYARAEKSVYNIAKEENPA